nr:glycosyltransferase family 39 protein [Chloroflexota bacterium]
MNPTTDCLDRVKNWIVFALLGTLVALCLLGIQVNSPTLDEPAHIARGYRYLITGKLDLDESPPLVDMLSALPVLFHKGIIIPPPHPVHRFSLTEFADMFVWVYNDAEAVINSGRLAIIFLSVLLGYAVFLWARELWGVSAGLLALFFYVLDPNILAHSQLATNDLGAACFIFIATYFLWRFLRRHRSVDLAAAGLLLGLAQAAKFSALLLLPVFCVMLLIEACRNRISHGWRTRQGHSAHRGLGRATRSFCVTLLILSSLAFFSLWASYRFETVPLQSFKSVWNLAQQALNSSGGQGSIKDWVMPFATYARGLRSILRRLERAAPVFLMGRHFSKGPWYHILVAFAIKTPIPTLILLAAATYLTLRGKHSAHEEFILYLPITVFFLAGVIFSSLNLNYRHILPILPFAFVIVSKIVTWNLGHLGQLILAVLCLWYAIGTASIYPHCLAYFNEFVGGSGNGYKYLVGADLDWGQDLKNLKTYMAQNDLDIVHLAYFGSAHPDYYGIQAQPLPTNKPEDLEIETTPVYAISATYLQGSYLEDVDQFSWLRRYTPVAKIGYSIFLYRLP